VLVFKAVVVVNVKLVNPVLKALKPVGNWKLRKEVQVANVNANSKALRELP